MNFRKAFLSIALLSAFASTAPVPAAAQTNNNTVVTEPEVPTAGELPIAFLTDVNGDGQVNVLAFGDSITRGVGDFTPPGEDVEVANEPSGEAGYPLRVERFLSISVANGGVSGEQIVRDGIFRFPKELARVRPDVVMLAEGSNDAERFVPRGSIARAYQTIINISRANGVKVVVGTITPFCCDREQFNGITQEYNQEIRAIAVANGDIVLADVGQAYLNVCRGFSQCRLLNLPEGLHPNTQGHDISGEMVTAALLGIDLLDPTGPSLLEQALMLPAGSVETVPNPAPPPMQTAAARAAQ